MPEPTANGETWAFIEEFGVLAKAIEALELFPNSSRMVSSADDEGT